MVLRSAVVRAPEDAPDAFFLREARAPEASHVVRRRSRGVIVATVSWIEDEPCSLAPERGIEREAGYGI